MRPITKFRFSAALVAGWQANGNMAGVLLRAADMPIGRHSPDLWAAMQEQVALAYPAAFPGGYFTGARTVRAFVAVHFQEAVPFLEKGLPNSAQRAVLLSSGAATQGRLAPATRTELAEYRAEAGSTVTIRARSLDKRHDWSTVK